MSDIKDEPNEQVAAMLARRFPRWESYLRSEIADRVDGIYAERVAQARREGAAEVVAKVEGSLEWRDVREFGEQGTPFSNGAKRMAAKVRAALRGDA